MTNKFVTALNTVSGVVGLVPAGYLTHPVFGQQLVAVDQDAKDFVPELYTPKTADEFEQSHPSRAGRLSKKAALAEPVEDDQNKDEDSEA